MDSFFAARAADSRPYGREAVRWLRICGTSRTPSPTGGRRAVRFRRRGGRPRPPADMVECRTNGPPGASAPTGGCGRARCGIAGGASPSPTGWYEYRGRRGSAGRRGRRPLRVGADGRGADLRDVEDAVPYGRVRTGAVRIRGTSRAAAPTGWCEYRGRCEAVGLGANLREGQAPPLRGGANIGRVRSRRAGTVSRRRRGGCRQRLPPGRAT